jgi:hypothetical protein
MNLVPLECNGPAGAAFLLRGPARHDLTLFHPEGTVSTRSGSVYLTVQLSVAPAASSLRDETWRIVQEALDLHAATYRYAVGTNRGEHEYVRWLRAPDGYDIMFTDTMEAMWAMTAHATVKPRNDAQSAPPSAVPPPPTHHPAFRFYRLSLLAEDLFDAYRNAYLALECIVSDESPPNPGEKEIPWLKRVLNGSLRPGMPGGMPIDAAIEELYKLGRLPLFHAKMGRRFYSPYSKDREHVQAMLGVLHAIVAGGWAQFSQELTDAWAQASFKCDEVICGTNAAAESLTPIVEVVDVPRRFGNLWARLTLPAPQSILSIQRFTLRHRGQDRCWTDLPEPWSTAAISSMIIELNYLDYNVRAPNPAHPI